MLCRGLNPHEVRSYCNCKLPPSTKTPGQLEPEVWWYWLPHNSPPSHPEIRRMSTIWSHPLWIITIKLLTTPSRFRPHSFEDFSRLRPPWPGKAIKLFFSTSAKTLPLSFNSVLGVQKPDSASVRALRTLGPGCRKMLENGARPGKREPLHAPVHGLECLEQHQCSTWMERSPTVSHFLGTSFIPRGPHLLLETPGSICLNFPK